MKPKQKAKELVDRFENLVGVDYTYDEKPIFELQKQCALICVDEIIDEVKDNITTPEKTPTRLFNKINYWQQVKEETQKL